MAKEKSELVVVKFVQGHGIYAKGDIAGFSPEEAEKLTDGKAPVAVEWDGKEEKAQKPVEDKSVKNK